MRAAAVVVVALLALRFAVGNVSAGTPDLVTPTPASDSAVSATATATPVADQTSPPDQSATPAATSADESSPDSGTTSAQGSASDTTSGEGASVTPTGSGGQATGSASGGGDTQASGTAVLPPPANVAGAPAGPGGPYQDPLPYGGSPFVGGSCVGPNTFYVSPFGCTQGEVPVAPGANNACPGSSSSTYYGCTSGFRPTIGSPNAAPSGGGGCPGIQHRTALGCTPGIP